MQQVSPAAAPRRLTGTPARQHLRSKVATACIAIYLLLTPLQAYLYENFPWQLETPPSLETVATWQQAEAFWLRFAHNRYTPETFFDGASYCHDAKTNTDIYRMVLNLSEPIPQEKCRSNLLTKLNNGAILSVNLEDRLCAFAASPNATRVDAFSACQKNVVAGIEQSIICAWLTPGNDLDKTLTASGLYTYYNIFFMRPSIPFLYTKLAWRFLLVIYLGYRLYFDYFRHCRDLLRDCALVEGHRCEVFFGDPTSLVLLDPWITLVMSLDVWLSAAVIGSSTLAAVQMDDTWQFMLGCIYLSRLVWIAYFAVAIASPILKRLHMERRVSPVDPTFVSLATMLVSGPMTYQQGQSAFFTRVYLWLFNAKAPDPHTIEVGYATTFFLSTIATLPFILGLASCPRVRSTVMPSGLDLVSIFASLDFNDWKHRMLFRYQIMPAAQTRDVLFYGGNLHAWFHANPSFRRALGLSQRGLDCYVLVFNVQGRATECIRVSLLRLLDTNQPNVIMAKTEGDAPFCKVTIEVDNATSALSYVVVEPHHGQCRWLE
ncbi:hypothetical protein SDRG_06428 [Saprolegnia diclina VS20]|uniref:Uncharacterized protein n=2 Tax=Saprolegnia diclina (strain VS20) TaxID=1156394 RepID=T0RV06_SAPDV|nr:hypothetical protein SDRG_06428 [Saprolegnia diclina VS20]EQC36323.1 hypothetical protein SDRG_06428 [Saprolegnia diclina VS20]|eukprot:XP_008610429.1 hypothetical protein SDRG_06428 [Saprolegnia diclina VS20]